MLEKKEDSELSTAEKLKRLQEENDLLKNIIHSASESIYAKDLDGRYTIINEAGANYLGKSVEEVIGRTDEELSGHSAKHITQQDNLLLSSGEPVFYENKNVNGNDEAFFWTSKSPLKNVYGELIGLIGISRDITETKRAADKYRFIFDNAPIAFWEEDFSEVKTYLDYLKTNVTKNLRHYFEAHPEEVEKCVSLIKLLNVNQATVQMNAANSKKELLSSLNDNFTPESERIYIDELVALGNGETEFQKEASFINNDGEVLDVIFNISVMPGYEKSLSLILVSVIDVSDMHKIAHELTNIKHRYQSIVEAQTEMICRVSPKGIILFENAAFNRFFEFKYNPDNSHFLTLFPPDELDKCKAKLASLSITEPSVSCELRNYDQEGNLVWQEWSITAFFGTTGVLLGYQAVGSDVTERKNAQEALAASEARWRSVFSYADDLILTLNTSGYILSINDYRGLPNDAKWAGKKIDEVLRPENASRVITLLNSVVTSSQPLKTEIDIIPKEGGKTTFGVAISPVSYGQRVLSVVCIARDITETKQIEKKTKEALIEGEEKERMRVSQELHDGLGQLFTAIKFNLQEIRSSIQPDADSSLINGVNLLEENVGHAFREVKNISQNLMPDVLWHFGIKPAVEDLIEKTNASTDLKVSLEMIDMDERFSKDLEQALFRICQELLNNSVKHSSCSNIYVQFIKHVNTLILMVEDDGVGYNPETIHHGSGLQNIQSRVDVFDGRVETDSGKNQGTVTTIEIPLSKELK